VLDFRQTGAVIRLITSIRVGLYGRYLPKRCSLAFFWCRRHGNISQLAKKWLFGAFVTDSMALFRPNQRHQSICRIDISQNAAYQLLKPSVLTLLHKDGFYRDTCVLMGKKAVFRPIARVVVEAL
jgi:hypothetical protein